MNGYSYKSIYNGKIHKNKMPREVLVGKLCKKCRTFKQIDDFHLSSKHRDGHQTYCKACKCQAVKESNNYSIRYQLLSPEQKDAHKKRSLESYHRRKEMREANP